MISFFPVVTHNNKILVASITVSKTVLRNAAFESPQYGGANIWATQEIQLVCRLSGRNWDLNIRAPDRQGSISYVVLLFLVFVLKKVPRTPWKQGENELSCVWCKLAATLRVTQRSCPIKKVLISQQVTHAFWLQISYEKPSKSIDYAPQTIDDTTKFTLPTFRSKKNINH